PPGPPATMSKSPWRDDNLRQEAERLIASYGHLWPARCDHIKCTKPFPLPSPRTSQSGNFSIRRFRCSGCKTTFGVSKAIEILRPIQQDPDLAAQHVSAMMQPQLMSALLLPPREPPLSLPPPIPLDRSLHMSDLDSIHEDDDMLDASDNPDDSADDSSPLVHYVSLCLSSAQSDPILVKSTPQSVYPSQLSPWSGGFQSQPHLMFQPQPQPSAPHSPSLHPSQWSYMSGATQVPTLTQVPQTQIAPSPSPAPQAPSVAPQVQAPEFRASPQAESSTAAGKRRHMEASTWLQKQPRLDASYHMAPDQSSAIQQAWTLSQLQALVTEVSQLRKELQESRQALEDAKAGPQPATVTYLCPPQLLCCSSASATSCQAYGDCFSPQQWPGHPSHCPEPVVPTYANAARQGLTEAQLAVIQSMKPPPRPFKARQPASAALKPDTAPIYNISFVGKSICEFLVDATYQTKFIESMQAFTFRHLPNFDPAVPQDPNVTLRHGSFPEHAVCLWLSCATDLPDLTAPATSDLPSAASEPVVTPESASDETTATKDPAAEDSAGSTDGDHKLMSCSFTLRAQPDFGPVKECFRINLRYLEHAAVRSLCCDYYSALASEFDHFIAETLSQIQRLASTNSLDSLSLQNRQSLVDHIDACLSSAILTSAEEACVPMSQCHTFLSRQAACLPAHGPYIVCCHKDLQTCLSFQDSGPNIS
ncbi:MAG: hypothetical protein BYD32DRAFT_456726, partial [Podila humilis]